MATEKRLCVVQIWNCDEPHVSGEYKSNMAASSIPVEAFKIWSCDEPHVSGEYKSNMAASRIEAFVWGNNQFGQLGLGFHFWLPCEVEEPTKLIVDNISWTQIACGYEHTVALSSNGEVFTWGDNFRGELGHGDGQINKKKCVPTKVESLTGLRIVKVACGRIHTAAITDEGKLLTW